MVNEKRLIDANALFELLKEQREKETGAYSKGRNNGINVAIGAIRNEQICPTVDAVEVVHGRWIPIIDEPTPLRKMPMLSGYKCSVCGRYEEEEEPYCNCGAKMDGDGNA